MCVRATQFLQSVLWLGRQGCDGGHSSEIEAGVCSHRPEPFAPRFVAMQRTPLLSACQGFSHVHMWLFTVEFPVR